MKKIVYFLIGCLLFGMHGYLSAEDTDAKKEPDTDSLTRLLEIGINLSNLNEQGPESMGSVLGSIRVSNSLQSSKTELYAEKRKSSKEGPGIQLRYSHPLKGGTFIGLSIISGTKVRDERNSFGSQGTIINDTITTRINQYGVKFGLGPLDYFSRFSYVVDFGVELNNNSGPYNTWSYKTPQVDPFTGSLTPFQYFLGNGQLAYNSKAFTTEAGIAGGWKRIALYGLASFQIMKGTVELNANSINANASYGSDPLQIAYLKRDIPLGLYFGLEAGTVLKFDEHNGFKIGAYYAYPFMKDDPKPKGYYYQYGVITPEALAVESAASRMKNGLYGITFGYVRKL